MAKLPPKNDVLFYENFTLRRTTPIFYEQGDQIDGPIASGTFFQVDGRVFLITVAHTLHEGFKAEHFCIPSAPKKEGLIDLGKCYLYIPQEKKYDVCAIELLDHLKKKELRKNGWQLLTLSNVKAPSANGLFLLFGFPYEIRNAGRTISSYNPLSAYADRRPPPKGARNRLPGNLDLFFEYGAVAGDLQGNDVNVPKLPGASGCSIWEIPEQDTLLTPPRVVGVQVSFLRNRWFRAVDWRLVAKALGMADPQLQAHIEKQFGSIVQK